MSKIVIVTPYSKPSACGVWKRAEDDISAIRKLLGSSSDPSSKPHISNHHKLQSNQSATNRKSENVISVFSSNILKGTKNILPPTEEINGIQFKRFRSWFSFGGSSLFFIIFFSLLRLRPDIIHTHGYRHPHSLQSLVAGKLMGKKVFLTAHAPFEKDFRRSIALKSFDWFYDRLIGWWEIRLYYKIFMTTKWEEQYLRKLGARDNQLVYAPNGIDEVFLQLPKPLTPNLKPGDSQLRAFYMGRVDPVKRIEWIITAAQALPETKILISGPLNGYDTFSFALPNLTIKLEKYDKKEFLETARQYDVYLLPSARESFGMTMLEAMSQGCIVLSSNTRGAQEFIVDGKNGFIASSEEEFIQKLQYVRDHISQLNSVRKAAIETAQQYPAEKSGESVVKIYRLMLPTKCKCSNQYL